MKRLGIVRHRFAQPLSSGLRSGAGRSAFELIESGGAGTAELAVRLRRGELDGSYLSPIDYAREYARWRIVPSVGVSSEKESAAITLLFREGLHHINSIAADPGAASEIVLAHLIFSEKYGIAPAIIPLAAPGKEALGKADAVLLAGDQALEASPATNRLDLVDEWYDITGLPYVHGFWVSPPDALTPSELELIVEAGLRAPATPEGQAQHDAALSRFRYRFDDEERAALAEFYRIAYYHGILKDIPDLNLHSLGNRTPISPISAN
jgi:predicted solute-binding protein